MENTSHKHLLKVEKLSFAYNDKPLLRRINFSLKEGEIIGVAGESGSGKTTLLKLLSGLLDPVTGSILFKGDKVPGPKDQLIPGHPSIKLMKQDFDLMPFISVDDNIVRNTLSSSANQRKRMLGYFHNKLKLGRQKGQKANETSGGQKQRVALASTLATKPEVMLLDEPFSNLDYNLKTDIIDLLLGDWKPKGMLVVTHEPTDLMKLADRLLIMKEGRIIQEGSSEEVYLNPVNEYAAELLGPINRLEMEEARSIGLNTEKPMLIRPFQLKIKKKGPFEVVECHFHGSYYLLECYHAQWDKTLLIQSVIPVIIGLKINVLHV